MKLVEDIKTGKLHSAYKIGAFDESIDVLKSKGYRIISLEEQAWLRAKEGLKAFVSSRGNWTKEGFIYVPKDGIYLSKNSPIMANAKEAADCYRHRPQRDYYLSKEQIESSLENSVKITGVHDNLLIIPASDIPNNLIGVYSFGKNANVYSEFLKENKINTLRFYLGNLEDKPFARQAWFCRIGYGGASTLDGTRVVDYTWTRGVRKGESKEKNTRGYTAKEVLGLVRNLKTAGYKTPALSLP